MSGFKFFVIVWKSKLWLIRFSIVATPLLNHVLSILMSLLFHSNWSLFLYMAWYYPAYPQTQTSIAVFLCRRVVAPSCWYHLLSGRKNLSSEVWSGFIRNNHPCWILLQSKTLYIQMRFKALFIKEKLIMFSPPFSHLPIIVIVVFLFWLFCCPRWS